MNFFVQSFNVLFYQPLLNALIWLYQFLPVYDFGIAVIVLTILIRLILSPLMFQSLKSQKSLTELQEKTQQIQKKYNHDKEKQVQEIIELYRREKINPLSAFVPLLIQLPLLIALYRVFWRGLQPEALDLLYSFVPRPEVIDPSFLGILDLSQPSPVLASLAGIMQFLQSKQLSSKRKNPPAGGKKRKESADRVAETVSKQMLYFFPILTFLILLRIPSAVGLYWIITTLFSMGQQYLIYKPQPQTKALSAPEQETKL